MENRRSKLRQEKKYLIHRAETKIFERMLIDNGFYLNHLPNYVNNVYLENNFLTSSHENIEGECVRSKHRIRWYNQKGEFFLEEKIKLSSSGFKIKLELSSNNLIDAIHEAEQRTKKKAIIQNSYFRKYYQTTQARITIDSDLKFKKPFCEGFKPFPKSIIEMKYNTSDQVNFDVLLGAEGMQLSKNSKYIEGLFSLDLI